MFPQIVESVQLISKPAKEMIENTVECQKFLKKFRMAVQSGTTARPQDLRNCAIDEDVRRTDPSLPQNPTPKDAYLWLVKSFPNLQGLRKAYRKIKYVSHELERNSRIETFSSILKELAKLFPIRENELPPVVSTQAIWDALAHFDRNMFGVTDQNFVGLMQTLDLRAKAYGEPRLPDTFGSRLISNIDILDNDSIAPPIASVPASSVTTPSMLTCFHSNILDHVRFTDIRKHLSTTASHIRFNSDEEDFHPNENQQNDLSTQASNDTPPLLTPNCQSLVEDESFTPTSDSLCDQEQPPTQTVTTIHQNEPTIRARSSQTRKRTEKLSSKPKKRVPRKTLKKFNQLSSSEGMFAFINLNLDDETHSDSTIKGTKSKSKRPNGI